MAKELITILKENKCSCENCEYSYKAYSKYYGSNTLFCSKTLENRYDETQKQFICLHYTANYNQSETDNKYC